MTGLPTPSSLAETTTEDTPGVRWTTLMARHERQVLLSLLAEGLGLDDARDVSQDAWARVWQQHQRGALGDLVFPGIVITQARFLARDLLRRRRVVPDADGEPVSDARASDASAESRLASSQSLARVEAVLRGLPAQKERVFRLACEDGVPHAEIAERVGLSTQRVKQIVWEVRGALKATLREER